MKEQHREFAVFVGEKSRGGKGCVCIYIGMRRRGGDIE